MSDEGQESLGRTLPVDLSAIAEQMRRAAKKRPCFVAVSGVEMGRVIPLEGIMILGRDPECDVVLRDDGVSRFHAEVRCDGPARIVIRDLGSTNGIYAGGERVQEAVLSDGEKVLLGRSTVLKFVLQDELEQQYQRLMYESSTRDALTEAYNRRYFSEKLDTDLSFARRQAIPCTVAMFDIDHFKRVNDTHGHLTGDQVLITVTRAVREIIRAEDTLARYGGEEFAVIAQGTDLEGGRVLGERIRSCIARQTIQALDREGATVRVTASVGVATVPPGHTVPPEAVVAAADANLYQAKQSGRNRVVATELSQDAPP